MKDSKEPSALRGQLDPEGYLAAHEAFRCYSNQKSMLMEWFDHCGLLDLGAAAPSVLAVGAGGGDIDVELIDRLGQRGSFSYDAIDPNRAALERFRSRCESLSVTDSRQVWFHHGDFESFEPGRRYDLIHFVHAVYSLENLDAGVSKAYRLLEEGGRMAMVCSTDEGVNRFKRDALAAIGRPLEGTTVPEASLLTALASLEGSSLELGMIPSRINVEPCLSRTYEGESVLNFFLQADFRALAPDAQEAVIEVLESHCVGEVGERGIVQPMLGITLQKDSVAAGRRVEMKVSPRRELGEIADESVLAS